MKTNDPYEKYRYMDSLEGVPQSKDSPSFKARFLSIAPGVMVCALITLSSVMISEYYSSPVMLICLLIGMAFHFLFENKTTQHGIQFTSQQILKIGVALIGARIALSQFTDIGIYALAGISGITLLIFAMGPLLSKCLNMDREQGVLIGGATAICGASAALAISSMLPSSKKLEQNTLTAVIGVTAIGTLAMVIYPILLGFLGVDEYYSGVIIGGTIHDVSQVVGAGYSVSPQAGDVAVIVKLVRVFMLLPILFGLAWLYKGNAKKNNNKEPFIPLFLIGFLVLAVLNSLGLLTNGVSQTMESLSKWMLVMAISAVGLKTSAQDVLSLGYRPVLLVVLETLILFVFYYIFTSFHII